MYPPQRDESLRFLGKDVLRLDILKDCYKNVEEGSLARR